MAISEVTTTTYICDRCNKETVLVEAFEYSSVDSWSTLITAPHNMDFENAYDLCDECGEKLREFLKGEPADE